MPHIIVEYADKQIDDAKIDSLLMAIHHAVAESGLFEIGHIKTRAYPFRAFTNAGESEPYLHVQARIKSGRDADNKKNLSDVILAAISKQALPVAVATVEIIDMDRNTYGKVVN